MLYGFTDSDSNAKAPDWYGTDVVIGLEGKRGMLMPSWPDVGWNPREVGGFDTVRGEES